MKYNFTCQVCITVYFMAACFQLPDIGVLTSHGFEICIFTILFVSNTTFFELDVKICPVPGLLQKCCI